jgi:CBS domain-containing protein
MIANKRNLLGLTAEDLMTREVLTLRQEMSIKEAALMLVEHRISGAPVVDDAGRCIGVFSTGDLLRSYSQDIHERSVPAERTVTCPFVKTFRDRTGQEVALCNLPLGVCSIQRPAKDPKGADRVICSQPHDVPVDFGVVEVEKLPENPVQQFMTPDPVTVPCDASIQTVARMMTDAHIHRVIVVREGNIPAGVISATDLLAALAYAQGL